MSNLGARVYGLGAINMGVAALIWCDLGEGWPHSLPGRAAFVYVVGALLVLGGVLINWRHVSQWGAGLLTALCAAMLVLLDLWPLATHATVWVYYESFAEELALVAAGTIAYASSTAMPKAASSRLVRAGRFVFGLCLLVFGTSDFVYLRYTASLVPIWLPPGQIFWTYVAGIAAVAAGLAILSGVFALTAAQLLTLMYVIFGTLVHARILLSGPDKFGNWQENATNLMLLGAAWIVADSLAAAKRTPNA